MTEYINIEKNREPVTARKGRKGENEKFSAVKRFNGVGTGLDPSNINFLGWPSSLLLPLSHALTSQPQIQSLSPLSPSPSPSPTLISNQI